MSKWHNPDAMTHHNYACSYILRQSRNDLFRVDLHVAHGFFELSEFVSPDDKTNFMIEQISRVGKVKINIFDKYTGNPLAMLCDNMFKNEDEQRLFELSYLHDVAPAKLRGIDEDCNPDDYVGIAPDQTAVALLQNLPKPSQAQAGFLSKVSKWAKKRGEAPKDVLEIQILKPQNCSWRALCALGVIVHARRGLQLPTSWQDAVPRSGSASR